MENITLVARKQFLMRSCKVYRALGSDYFYFYDGNEFMVLIERNTLKNLNNVPVAIEILEDENRAFDIISYSDLLEIYRSYKND